MQHHVLKIKYPTGNTGTPEQHIIIYMQKHFDRFNKEVISNITRIHNNLLYHTKG